MENMQTAQPMTEVSENESTSSQFRFPAVTTFFSRQWWWITLVVLVGMAVLARLGLWQLDRLEQRRSRNAAILEQLALPPITLLGDSLPAEPAELKNRQAMAQGEYDHSRQVALVHQNWDTSPGFHLITPLVLEGKDQSPVLRSASDDGRPTAVLVDRGWLPAAQLGRDNWSQYDATGPVVVDGYIKLSQTAPREGDLAPLADGSAVELSPEWYRVDVAAIEAQMPYKLLPIYLQEAPTSEGNTKLPFSSELDADLSEGNHFSYAVQWFIFATILGVGYVYFVGKKTSEKVDARQ